MLVFQVFGTISSNQEFSKMLIPQRCWWEYFWKKVKNTAQDGTQSMYLGWGSRHRGFPGGSDSKEYACSAGDPGSIPELARKENSYAL